MAEPYSDDFLKAWNALSWLLEDESDKDRAWRWWQTATQTTSAERASVLEECAKIAEEQARQFLSPEYASNQPFGSTCERFACEEVAKAIRELIPVSVGGT